MIILQFHPQLQFKYELFHILNFHVLQLYNCSKQARFLHGLCHNWVLLIAFI